MNAAFIRIAMLAVALGSMTLPVAAVPQQAGVQNQSPTGVPVDPKDPFGTKAQDDKDRSSMPTDMQHRLQEQRQTERQKRIIADTDRLVQLANQLHSDVAKSDKDILSLDVIRRADEIEKLAHAVKEHMKG
jgi:hypothetical protein